MKISLECYENDQKERERVCLRLRKRRRENKAHFKKWFFLLVGGYFPPFPSPPSPAKKNNKVELPTYGQVQTRDCVLKK